MPNETRGIEGKKEQMIDESPGWVHPPDELGVLVLVVHPRRRRRHESHGNRALTRINSFRHAAETKSERRAAKLLRRLVVPAWAGQAGEGTALVVVASGLRRRRFYSPDGVVTLMRSLRYVSAGVAKLGYLYMGRLDFAIPLFNLI